MKRLLYAFLLFLPGLTTAQSGEGVVLYDQKVNMHRRLVDASDEVKAMIPEFQTNRKELMFNASETIYRDYEALEEDVINGEAEGGNFTIRMRRPSNIVYRNWKDDTKIEQREFMGKNFLIKGETEKLPWKLTGEQKSIQGYSCTKAIFQDTSRTLEVWFTPSIPVFSGPETYSGLPGMILESNLNDGEVITTAAKVEFKSLDKDAILAPDKGKEVTQEEYDKIVEERMKEMGITPGRGGGIRIIRMN